MDEQLHIERVQTAEEVRYEVIAQVPQATVPRAVEWFYDLENARAYVRKHQVIERRRVD